METILGILQEIREDADFEGSADFVADQLLDSFDFMTLVDALEDTFEIEIDGRDIIPENFISLKTIADLVEKSGGTL